MKITHSIAEYISKNALRKNIICKFSDGKLLHLHKGRWIDEDDFEKEYPKYDYKKFNSKGKNPDTTSLA
jgi:hypothetical protein